MLVEAMFDDERTDIDAHMRNAGYFKARELGVNVFYCRDARDVSRVAAASNRVPLHHTQHPLDANEPVTPE
jgi:hypothetical protein